MENILPALFLDTLVIGIVVSIILMVLIQKLKSMEILKKSYQICIINLICAFGLGIPFAITFYSLEIREAIWVGILAFIGAPSIYEALKSQTIINYTPNSLKSTIQIPKENKITRE